MAGSLIKKGIRSRSSGDKRRCLIWRHKGVTGQRYCFINRISVVKCAFSSEMGGTLPLGRIGAPEDIGKIILFLADRSQSEILVGHIVTADGGITLKSTLLPNA
ncbi:hypothetical protein PRIPAC_94743 [Pristionchus pacificus]|uniref:Uncharacterized protein n=1 Tax=Pristionchus pacificus TaxID=54126 RepID=A0A2A6CHL3_PRIPA|nr:hypothetical protein PRIPAC_94743 [Pristionchus pacificus]|eukprot:PDM77577.1 hypothetical protein PRIPAC_34444 [Pristionchus pacificus]